MDGPLYCVVHLRLSCEPPDSKSEHRLIVLPNLYTLKDSYFSNVNMELNTTKLKLCQHNYGVPGKAMSIRPRTKVLGRSVP
jgi:hypothetical protein